MFLGLKNIILCMTLDKISLLLFIFFYTGIVLLLLLRERVSLTKSLSEVFLETFGVMHGVGQEEDELYLFKIIKFYIEPIWGEALESVGELVDILIHQELVDITLDHNPSNFCPNEIDFIIVELLHNLQKLVLILLWFFYHSLKDSSHQVCD